MSKWISVKERLPKPNIAGSDDRPRCLVYNGKTRDMAAAELLKYDEDDEDLEAHWYCAEDLFDIAFITHWMELPEPPKDADHE